MAVRHDKGVAFHHTRQQQHSQGRQNCVHQVRIQNPMNSVHNIDSGSKAEDAHPGDQRPNKPLPAVSVVVLGVRRTLGCQDAHAQQVLVAEICQRVHRLCQHHTAARDREHGQLPSEDNSVAYHCNPHRPHRLERVLLDNILPPLTVHLRVPDPFGLMTRSFESSLGKAFAMEVPSQQEGALVGALGLGLGLIRKCWSHPLDGAAFVGGACAPWFSENYWSVWFMAFFS
mmetsp:Transcript_6056/g.8193  ORF Transcript_6056/g.8193 Transcript_6056/m.8193 type:complete len:229 (+) Transcript_6056:917-1603(+)